MRHWVKISHFSMMLLTVLVSTSFAGEVSGARIEQWLTHHMEEQDFREPLPAAERNWREFDERYQAQERSKRAHRITDRIARNGLRDLLLLSAPHTATEVKAFADSAANQQVSLSDEPGSQSTLSYGYNFFDDVAKAEYVSPRHRVLLQLENVMVWDDPQRIIRVRCQGEQVLDASGMRAYAAYFTVDRSLSVGLSRPLSRDVAARFDVVSAPQGDSQLAFAKAGLTLMIQTTSL